MVNHKQKLEEVEAFLAERKREYVDVLRFYIQHQDAELPLDEAELNLQLAEAGILFIEELGNRFFNWE
jgi:hypothetical protein